MEHLRQAAMMCDKLIVTVVPDRFVTKGFVINDERTRLFQVLRVKGVYDAMLCEEAGPWNELRHCKPDIYIRKDEYREMKQPEYAVAKELGIECRFTVTVPPSGREIVQRIWAMRERI